MIAARLRTTASRCLGLVLSAALMRPAVARATPVNVETLRPTQGAGGWTGAWDFGVDLSQGNVDKLQVSSAGGVQYQNLHPASTGFGARPRPPQAPRFFKDRFILSANIKWGKVSGARFLNSGYAHARYTRNLVPRFGVELLAQSQYNEFTLLRSRLVGGTGIRVDAIHRERFSLWGGTGYLLEAETNAIVPGDPHGAFLLNQRWNNYLVAQVFMLEGRLVMQNTVYAQPLWINFSDVRILEQFQLEGKLTEFFRLGVNLEVAHDNRPPQTISPTDITLSNYIRLQFG